MRLTRLLIAGLISLMAANAAAQDIKVGVAGPITGPLAFLGQHIKWGGELAVDEINQKGGVLGRKLVFLMQDSACRPADGVASAEKLLSQDRVDVMLGDVCSGSTIAVMPVMEKAQKPFIVTISTHPDITNKSGVGGNKWVFRTVAHDGMIADVVADKMKGLKSIAIVGEDTDYGRGAARLMKERLPPSVKIVSEDYLKQTETDFLPVLTRIRASKPDALATYVLDQQASNLMKQYQQFGLTIPLVGRPPLGSGVVADQIKSGKFDGSWTVYPYYDKFPEAKNEAFTRAYVQRYKQAPHYAGWGVYEGVLTYADAVRHAGTTDPEKVRDALAKSTYDAILGPMNFDAHQQARTRMMFIVVDKGAASVRELVAVK
jgi:branched-chain amino acid transport system substrate-binding protein